MVMFGDGDAGRTARDSSRKDGSGIGCKTKLGSGAFVVSLAGSAVGATEE